MKTTEGKKAAATEKQQTWMSFRARAVLSSYSECKLIDFIARTKRNVWIYYT